MTPYYSGISMQVELEELISVGESLKNLLNIDSHYPCSLVKKELQEYAYPAHSSFSTWSSEEEGVDQVLNRNVPQKQWVASVLYPQKKN